MNIRKILAAAMAGILVLGLAACSSSKSQVSALEDEIAQLKAENASLRSQLEALGVPASVDTAAVQNWNLSAVPQADGAKITLTAVPAEHTQTQSAKLLVCFQEQESASADCQWNGTAYTAEVDLPAQDGYWYYLILTDGGKNTQITLTSPENPVVDSLVYLASSLSSYCSLYVENYTVSGSTLTITGGYAQVQLPRISASQSLTLQSARLSFQLDGKEISTQEISLPKGEGSGSFEVAVSNISFEIPQMESDSQLDLLLVATLSDGTEITGSGGTWYNGDGQLNMVVG